MPVLMNPGGNVLKPILLPSDSVIHSANEAVATATTTICIAAVGITAIAVTAAHNTWPAWIDNRAVGIIKIVISRAHINDGRIVSHIPVRK
jgi:hypothetical protein